MNVKRRLGADLAVLKVSFKNVFAYKTDFTLAMALAMVASLVYILVWYAVYTFSGSSSISGLTLNGMVAYFVVIGSMEIVAGWDAVIDSMDEDIKEGNIMRSWIRPVSYVEQLFIGVIPGTLVFLALGTVPILALVAVLGGLQLSAMTVLAFAGELAIAYALSDLVGFIVGSMSIYLTDIWGIANGFSWVINIAGGSIIPLLFFPAGVLGALMLTPFPYMLYVPAGTFIGLVKGPEIALDMAMGAAWVAALAAVAWAVWSRASKRINVVGV